MVQTTENNIKAPSALTIPELALPKGGGSLQKLDGLAPNVDMNGTLSLSISLPITPARYLTPTLALNYQSTQGNTPFGLGFNVSVASIRRRTNKGVPLYNNDDVFIGPEGELLVPLPSNKTHKKVHQGITYRAKRFYSHRQSQLNHLEFWQAEKSAEKNYWLLKEADGTQHLFGFGAQARLVDPVNSNHIFSWLLEESWEVHGEHCVYTYNAEDKQGIAIDNLLEQTRTQSTQRYLKNVRYGNRDYAAECYAFSDSKTPPRYLLEVIFDYGEHLSAKVTSAKNLPTYNKQQAWLKRADSFSDYSSGFEIRTHRLCRRILMFHHFDELGKEPLLIKGLELDYTETPIFSLLRRTQTFGYANGVMDKQCLPPLELHYIPFATKQNPSQWQRSNFPNAFHEGPYQLVDLYGEGIPGILYKENQHYYYRSPHRATNATLNTIEQADAVSYADSWSLVNPLPAGGLDSDKQATMIDITGDGHLDCLVTRAGIHGFFALNKNQQFENFIPFEAFPSEFFHPKSQLIDMLGGGLLDLVLVGPKSVRIYPNKRRLGFGNAQETHYLGPDTLPFFQTSDKEFIAFSNLLGSSLPHLVRIEANKITCWPHFGRGQFAAPLHWANLGFDPHNFDPKRVYLADLDGSGVNDLIYAHADHLQIFSNYSGNGLAEPYDLPFPKHVTYDNLTQLSFADINGHGTTCLVLTAARPSTQHWIYDFSQGKKPYLLKSIDNKCGSLTRFSFRSSSQMWLDEKQENPNVYSGLPFPVQVLQRLEQEDQISGNLFVQIKQYRQAYYDQLEREFNGFGLVISQDSESISKHQKLNAAFVSPFCVKTWFYTGKTPESQLRNDYYQADSAAKVLASTYCVDTQDQILTTLTPKQKHELNNSIRGQIRRQETYGLDKGHTLHPYEVSESRYKVRLIQKAESYSAWLIMPLEKLSYHYERQPNDPQCQHEIVLKHDAYGFVLRQLNLYYPRRTPVTGPENYQDEQQFDLRYHDSEFSWIHIDKEEAWRLGLASEKKIYKSLVKQSDLASVGLASGEIFSFEQRQQHSPTLGNAAQTQLSEWVRNYYYDSEQKMSYKLGRASVQGLLHHTEIADISAQQLSQLSQYIDNNDQLKKLLLEKGNYIFHENYYWAPSAQVDYYAADQFFKLKKHINLFSGETQFKYDKYYFNLTQLTDPAKNQTNIAYDYRHLQIQQIIDANENTRAMAYDSLGRPIISTFYGEALEYNAKKKQLELTKQGFATLDKRHNDFDQLTLAQALADPKAAIRDWAEVYFYEFFTKKNGLFYPGQVLKLTSDRYPNDSKRQIRVHLTRLDGWGRTIAEMQRADAGDAYQRTAEGLLEKSLEKIASKHSTTRWLVNALKEYNNKGWILKEYHPYFLNSHLALDKNALTDLEYAFIYQYDPSGRVLKMTQGQGYFRRFQYFPWYQISEDENDTWLDALGEMQNKEK